MFFMIGSTTVHSTAQKSTDNIPSNPAECRQALQLMYYLLEKRS